MDYASYIVARTYTEKVGLIDWRIGKEKKRGKKRGKKKKKEEIKGKKKEKRKKRKKERREEKIELRNQLSLEWILFLFYSSVSLKAPTSTN